MIPFSRAGAGLDLNRSLGRRSRFFGFGVSALGLIKSVFVVDPTYLFGERIGDPDFIPSIVAGDSFVGVYPRGRILAVDLGVALYEYSGEDDAAYDELPPFHEIPDSAKYWDVGTTLEPDGGLPRHASRSSNCFF